jgi:glycosyltransferase involved in cell wall biosynthesis
MSKLVSVIIPCFNADKWLSEAIDSCLKQTYINLEVIVINDGSTDNSLEIIKSYGDKIIWEDLPHRSGNYARNRGFALSKGEYIQFLDADDYILPEKIEHQVSFLKQTGADVVYGDWRYQHHLVDGQIVLDDIKTSEEQVDILESLLANWWVALAAILYKRTAVEKSAGWDESLEAAQDRDFFLSVVMNGAKVAYQPGCYSIYRRHSQLTVSTSSKPRWLESHDFVLEKVQEKLLHKNELSMSYRYAIAKSYFELARESLVIDHKQYQIFIEKAVEIFPDFKFDSKRPAYKLVQNIFGFRQTEELASRVLLVKKFVNSIAH